MYNVILVIHVILALALVGIILMQRPDSSALAGLGGGDNMNFLSGKSKGNLVTKTTTILAVMFIVTSLSLAYIAKGNSGKDVLISETPAAAKVKEDAPKVAPKAPRAPVAKE